MRAYNRVGYFQPSLLRLACAYFHIVRESQPKSANFDNSTFLSIKLYEDEPTCCLLLIDERIAQIFMEK